MASTLDKSIWNKPGQPYVVPGSQPTSGQTFAEKYLASRNKQNGFEAINRQNKASEVAADVVDKSAGNIPLNEYGLVKNTEAPKPEETTNLFGNELKSISKSGSLAADAAEARNTWQQLKKAQDLAASYKVQMGTPVVNTNYTATGDQASQTKGGQAVSLAMQAFKNGTPYVWGGNSLSKGIDCSGLVQQVYSQLGVNLPRTTYEQAKSGKIVSLTTLQPGDLVFYNTGSSDPNGIGQYSHVAIYQGNGQIVDARNTRSGMKSGSIYDPGTPVLGVRPW